MTNTFKVFGWFFCLCFVLTTFVFGQHALPKPNPERLVVDNAGVLTNVEQIALEKKLTAFNDSTSNQIAIVTIPSLNGAAIEDIAVQTFRAWGIGTQKNNNGILVLVAIKEKQVRIEVGKGLEGAIPDVTAKDIIENDLKPAFKAGNYAAGFDKATNSLAKAAVGEYKTIGKGAEDGGGWGYGWLIMIIVAFVVMMLLGRGGGWGGGLIAPLIFSGLVGGRMGREDGFGGGSGGSFGGFGGGSSGGGGASGSW